jgi:phosphatidate phosphatase APP1
MKNKRIKLTTSILLSAIVLAGCGSNLSDNGVFMENDAMMQASSITAQFTEEIEDENILIDDEYYKHFPDAVLGNEVINQIQAGVIPEYQPVINESNAVQSQSFLSVFNRKAIIDIYDSYGTSGKVTVTGRVYKKKSIQPVSTTDSKFRNIIRNIKYYTPDGIGNLDVNVSANGISRLVKTDSKGFFKASFDNTGLQQGVSTLSAKLTTTKFKYDIPQEQVVIDSADSNKVGIVSDIDDTVKYTGVNQKIKMIKDVLTGNYKTDKPYSGVSTLYKGILSGPASTGFDCLHYVTGSTVHLYSRIQEFLKLNRFPQGSLDLKKPGSQIDPTPADTYEYKVSRIMPIMALYPNKKFVFFGDTTQKDTEVYLKIKQQFPARVAGIYINNVNRFDQADPRFNGVILTDSAIDAAQDLFKKGIITQETLDQVINEVK